MDILKEIKTFDAEKELRDIKKYNESKYNILEWVYNLINKNLNQDFYLSNNYKHFYYEQLNDNFIDLWCLHAEIIEKSEQIVKMYHEITTKYINKIDKNDLIKMAEFCIKAMEINLETLKKLSSLIKINKDTFVFIEKYLTAYEFKLFCNKEIETIPLYANSINELYKIAKAHQMKIISKLQPVFKRAKVCKKNEYAFILVTQDELESLKSYNYVLKEPVNFPIWEIDHFKDMTFKDGKGEGIFTEFTPLA